MTMLYATAGVLALGLLLYLLIALFRPEKLQ